MLVDKYAMNLTPAEAKVCYSMSFKSEGDTIYWLWDARHNKLKHRVVLYKRGDMILGWGIRTVDGSVGFWVRRGYRKQGIGSKMVAKLKKHGPIKTYPYNAVSEQFFYKNEALRYKEPVFNDKFKS